MRAIKDTLFVLLQYLLPHHALSRLVGKITHCRWRPLKNTMIRLFIQVYGIDLEEAASADPDDYACFNAFFTRALRSGTRPLPDDPYAVVSPADGKISQIGRLTGQWLIQAKGRDFSAAALLGDEALGTAFADGEFATVYLSPRDYHRVHMPYRGRLQEMIHIPGRLFSVNDATAEGVENLYARNERVVCLFDTETGPMAVVLVGALLVASIETVWHGAVTPPTGREIRRWCYDDREIVLQRGAELGRFNMGSTVIVLFPQDTVEWVREAGQAVRMGEILGRRR
ncbi:phosphatidylserine decarboxylase [Methylomarinovum caldicuralii]|uniref:Phosphatidylserine decarboxylase proenzyme n=1 Tax=Methylomarinovum caldicuralii TaxID=438856 RepID=A0AAU9C616_9GAMM|nr:archaetidylserine decarboxylase [Methylomarinovum caldicuralii]BCX80901.1 phosphatidylserine decarboxylase [Methylomarinovum caldicuralii]